MNPVQNLQQFNAGDYFSNLVKNFSKQNFVCKISYGMKTSKTALFFIFGMAIVILSSCEQQKLNEIKQMVAAIEQDAGMNEDVTISFTSNVSVCKISSTDPYRGKIVIHINPAGIKNFSDDELRAELAHEMGHNFFHHSADEYINSFDKCQAEADAFALKFVSMKILMEALEKAGYDEKTISQRMASAEKILKTCPKLSF